jgi:succinate dehydrogenase/fumarate reductase cytochrome b subunit
MRILIRVQAASGLALAVFVALHLFNFALASLGPAAYDQVQRALRPVYQFPLFELLALAAALVVHVSAGLLRMRERRRRRAPETSAARVGWGLRLHRLSAYYLAVVVLGHALATRLPSLVFGVWPESSGVAFSLWWMPLFFYPYYFLLALCGLYHALYGSGMAARALGLRRAPVAGPVTLRWVCALGALASIAALLALGGVTYPIPDPADNDYARLYARYLGVDLGG